MEKIVQLPPAVTAVITYDYRLTDVPGRGLGYLSDDAMLEMQPIVDSVTFLQPRYAPDALTLSGHAVVLLAGAVAEIKALPVQHITKKEYTSGL